MSSRLVLGLLLGVLLWSGVAQGSWQTSWVCRTGTTTAEGVSHSMTVCWTEASWHDDGINIGLDTWEVGGGSPGDITWFYDSDGDGRMDCWKGVTDSAVITSPYGVRPTRYHYGVDVGSVTANYGRGAAVRSMAAGQVIGSGYDSGNGNFVRIRHFDGLVSTYSHLLTRDVALNAWVSPGFTIGTMNCTGSCGSEVFGPNAVQGTHLHLEVRTSEGALRTPETTLDPIAMMSDCD
jgi:murein DD-endopeptidase MepM/ murein hydrolase activator NlpD